jgi:hypothetical protein
VRALLARFEAHKQAAALGIGEAGADVTDTGEVAGVGVVAAQPQAAEVAVEAVLAGRPRRSCSSPKSICSASL